MERRHGTQNVFFSQSLQASEDISCLAKRASWFKMYVDVLTFLFSRLTCSNYEIPLQICTAQMQGDVQYHSFTRDL